MEEVIQTSGVKIPNCVLVNAGFTNTAADEETFDFLNKHGKIERSIKIDDPESEFHKQAIVEYSSGSALQSLSPLPHSFQSKTHAELTIHVRALSDVYAPTVSKTVTQTYLSELKQIAKLAGKDFAAVLRNELSVISEAVQVDVTEAYSEDINPPNTQEKHTPESTEHFSPLPSTVTEQHVHPDRNWSSPPAPSNERTHPALNLSVVNPPEIQKMIVEHIVRNEDSAMQIHIPMRLRLFSGRCPYPNNEVDYETWRSNVELVLKDTKLSDLHKSRKLLESLSSPAIDIVRHLSAESPPKTYLEILDSAFSTVEDGDDLFAKYLNTWQEAAGEKPSAYLQRLQVMLNTTFRRGGVCASEIDRQLLRQFVRGCWDNALLSELQLESHQKKENPPTFAELLRLLRTAENKRMSKATRMKQHFSASKSKASSQYQGASVQCEDYTPTQWAPDSSSEIQDLKRQIANLQSQLTRITQKDGSKKQTKQAAPRSATTQPPVDTPTSQKTQSHSSNAKTNTSKRPKPWYCFRCGEDGHIKLQCESEPNPTLASSKRKQLIKKQQAWDVENGASQPEDLN